MSNERAITPEMLAARKLLGDSMVLQLKQNLSESCLNAAIFGLTPADREDKRLQYLALDALFDTLLKIARGEMVLNQEEPPITQDDKPEERTH